MSQGQSVNDFFPFMPKRHTNHVRSIKQYEPSTVVMGARTLLETKYYDPHGYEVGDNIELSFDMSNRLAKRVELGQLWNDELQKMEWDTTEVTQISYSPDGVVAYYRSVTYCPKPYWVCDSAVECYWLLNVVVQTDVGVTQCRYGYLEVDYYPDGRADSVADTCLFQREFDNAGRLLRRSFAGGSRGLDDYDVRYAYDSRGRKLYELNRSYDYSDSLAYHYNVAGGIADKAGKAWAQGDEADVFINCRPDGSPLESTWIWYGPEWEDGINPETRSIQRTWYDAMGCTIRREDANASPPVVEYDIEYWE